MIGVSSKGKLWIRPWRWAKTLFFVLSMVASLLVVCAPPLLIVVLDLVVPTALASNSSSPALSALPLAAQLKSFDFRSSLIDLPIISAARSLLILCVYAVCGGRGPYLGVAMLCGLGSMGYVLAKAIGLYGAAASVQGGRSLVRVAATEGLFLSSVALAMAHIVVAYRTSSRERRKLLVYRIDVEAVSTCKNDFPTYHKIALSK